MNICDPRKSVKPPLTMALPQPPLSLILLSYYIVLLLLLIIKNQMTIISEATILVIKRDTILHVRKSPFSA